MIAGAVTDVIERIIPKERIDQLVADGIRERIGTVSVSDLAAEWGCDERTVQRKLKKHGVPVCVISRKIVRVKIVDVEALLDGRKIGGSANGKITPFAKLPGRKKAA